VTRKSKSTASAVFQLKPYKTVEYKI